jgi:alkaline phosphatase
MVTTTDRVDATPAAFFTHSTHRENYDEIEEQLENFPFTYCHFSDSDASARDRGIDAISSRVKDALDTLSQSEGEFFLLVEEALIDRYSHSNMWSETKDELCSFTQTVATLKRYAETTPDTALVIVSDHATGGLMMVNNTTETRSHMRFNTTDHDSSIVPCFITGSNIDVFLDLPSVTDLPTLGRSLRTFLQGPEDVLVDM